MAADSIAKLAVIITGDEGPLARSLSKGEANIKGFSKVANATSSMGILKHLAGAAGFGGVAGAVALATVNLIRFTSEATKAAIEAEKAAAANNKTWSALDKTIRTTAGQWEIFKAGVSRPVGKTIGSVLAKDLRDALTVINVATGAMQRFQVESDVAATKDDERIKQLRKWASEQHGRKPPGTLLPLDAAELKRLEIEKDRAKRGGWWQEQQKAMAESELKAGLLMEERARQVREMLMTPLETYTAKMQELQELVNQGMLSTEFFSRAAAKAREDLEEAQKSKESMKKTEGGGTFAAVERFTMAGYSAVQQARAAAENKPNRAEVAIEKNTQKMAGGIDELNRTIAEKFKQTAAGLTNLN